MFSEIAFLVRNLEILQFQSSLFLNSIETINSEFKNFWFAHRHGLKELFLMLNDIVIVH